MGMDSLRTAIDEFPGGQAALAAALGVTQGAISHWRTGRSRPNVRDVARIEEKTGIPRNVLRPDIFGPQPEETAADPDAGRIVPLDEVP